jgi:tetratricopeptide (TPR) repeat protein
MKYRFFFTCLLISAVLVTGLFSSAKADYDTALNLYKEQKYADAIPLLEEWCGKYPRDPRGAYLLAQCYRNTKQNKKALDRLAIILEHHPDDDKCRFLKGMLLLPSSPAEAAVHFERAAKVDPDNAQYNYYLGNALMAQKKYVEAETSLQKAVSASPGNARAQLDFGRVLLLNNKAEEAIKHLKTAARGNDKETALYFLGVAQIQTKDYSGAVTTFSDAVALAPNDARMHFNLGLAREGQLGDQPVEFDKYQPVIEAYEKAVSLSKDIEDYSFRLGNAYETAVRSIYEKTAGNETLSKKALDYLAKARAAYGAINSDAARQRIPGVDQMIENIKNPQIIEEEVTL